MGGSGAKGIIRECERRGSEGSRVMTTQDGPVWSTPGDGEGEGGAEEQRDRKSHWHRVGRIDQLGTSGGSGQRRERGKGPM